MPVQKDRAERVAGARRARCGPDRWRRSWPVPVGRWYWPPWWDRVRTGARASPRPDPRTAARWARDSGPTAGCLRC